MATILVVEPSRNLRLLIEEELAERSHKVCAVATAAEARSRMAQERPDLVILEVALQKPDGLQFLGHLLGVNREVPIIVHTADVELAGGLIASLADACVVKSSDPGPLLAAVARVLLRAKLFATPWRAVDTAAEQASPACCTS